MRSLLLATVFCLHAAFAESVTITVHPVSGDGPANLVSNALPLRPGALTDARNVRVFDGSTELRVAARVLATWPQDKSIRSVLLQFSAPFTTVTKAFTVHIGSPRGSVDLPFTAVAWNMPTRVFTLPADYLAQSLVMWEQLPLGKTGFPDWDNKQLSNYSRIETVGTAACSRDDQYYDSISSTFQLYARTGQLKYLLNGRRWAIHHRRDQIYLSGSSVGHPRCSGNYLNNTRYTFPQGLAADYMLFGDEESRRVSGLVVDHFYMTHEDYWYYKAPNTRGFWTEREPAFALIGILAHYEATGNSAYIDKVRNRVASLHKMQVDNARRAWVHNLYDHGSEEGCSTTDYGSSPWMSGLLLEAIVRYHKLTGDPVARESILMAVDDLRARYVATGSYAGRSFVYLGCPVYRDGTPDLDNLISHAFGYAFKLTGNTAYRTFGTSIFNTAVASGYAGGAKQFNQQFRSSGHFVAYISQPAADTTAPTVSISSPTAGQAVSGTITLSASAADNVGVTGVQFLVNGQPFGTERTASPWSISLNTTTLINGVHSVAARARDAAGNASTSAAVSFTVQNVVADTTPPSVAITSPGAGQTVSGSYTLSANATDNVGVAGVQFILNGLALGTERKSAPWTIALDTTGLNNGAHTVAARARDAAGNVATSSTVAFNVYNAPADGTAPVVSLTSPKPDQEIAGLIAFTASASDNVGVAGVQFLVNGAPYGAEVTVAPYSIALHTGALPNGSAIIAARARDAAGNQATASAQVIVTTFPTLRLNAGGPQWFDTDRNTQWMADLGFSGGQPRSTGASISNAMAAEVYKTQRHGSSFSYTINVPNGTYYLTLDFAEIDTAITAAGQRRFNVDVNGSRMLTNLDVFAAAGGRNIAYDVRLPITVTDGAVRMVFTGVTSTAIFNGFKLTER